MACLEVQCWCGEYIFGNSPDKMRYCPKCGKDQVGNVIHFDEGGSYSFPPKRKDENDGQLR